jgi:MoxR-like ATPase
MTVSKDTATVKGGVSGTLESVVTIDRRTDGYGIDLYVGDKKGSPAFTVTSPESGRVAIEVGDSSKVDLVGARLTTGDTDVPKRQQKNDLPYEQEVPQGLKRNWKVKDGRVYFWFDGREVSLEQWSPSPLTPTNVPEVWGQEELLFNLAVSFKLGTHTMLTGPTGTGKTTVYKFMASILGWDLVQLQVSRGTEAAHIVGEYLPAESAGEFRWVDGPLTQAVRNSQVRPTIFVFDEMSRIGNQAELARVYSVLDGSRALELPETGVEVSEDGQRVVERIEAGRLYVGATSNPADEEEGTAGGGDYIGVQELDPALRSRFIMPKVDYMPAQIEAKALVTRVAGLTLDVAEKIVSAANSVRQAAEISFPWSMRESMAMANLLPYHTVERAAEIAVVDKANPDFRVGIRSAVQAVFGPDAKTFVSTGSSDQ